MEDAMASGTVARLVRDRGFGFVRTENGADVFFHKSSLQGVEFDSLSEGQAVEFDLGRGEKGTRAENVRLR
jgi:CspA family cold shock protein